VAPLLVIGLDGATLDLVRPWAAAGRLPVLAGLMARGAWGPLRSTVPAATFPAWTSLTTGVNPGRHGVLDFSERVPGTYRVRFVNGSWRRAPALWTRLSAAGRRVAVLTVPATYPPEPIDGVMVSGFDSPLTTAIDGYPQRVIRTEFIDHLEGSGRVMSYPRAAWNAWKLRQLTGTSIRDLLSEGKAMHKNQGLKWSQVALAANAPMLTKATMVDGRAEVGILPTGQVVGVIEELPTVGELIERIIAEADATLTRLQGEPG